VRSLAIILGLVLWLSAARAQDQESKLVDRLLKPDMTLQNSAQKKKFVADGVSVDKRATVGTFYLQKKSNSKTFSGRRDFSAWQFNSQSFRGANNAANTSSQKQITNSNQSVATPPSRGVRDAPEEGRKADGRRTFSGERPFLDRGKSQKSLDRQNPPMTIEQVRELLNKNK
jgi:hypothetical protein